MKIFTFYNTAEDAPESQRAIGRVWGALPGRGGGTVAGWHPVIINAPTEEEARAKLQAWWDGELAKERAKMDGKAARAKPKAKASPEPVEEEEEAIG